MVYHMTDLEPTFRDWRSVPEISDDRLAELSAQIKPVITRDGALHYIKDVDPRKIAFTWDPKITEEATDLVRVGSLPTIHACGYYGFFKPSVAEVLAQIDLDGTEGVVAFETLSEGLTVANILHGGDHHVTTTLLYGRSL